MSASEVRFVSGAASTTEAASKTETKSGKWDDTLLAMMAEWRVSHHMPRALACEVKSHVAETVAHLHAEVVARVSPHLQQGMDANQLIASVFETCRELTRRDSELDLLRASPAYVQPRRRYLGLHKESGEAFYAYDNPLDETLEAMFKTQPETWADVKAFAASCRSGKPCATDGLGYDPERVISDTIHGSEFRRYMAKVNIQGEEFPLIFMLYYDGLELTNGLGQARLTHELGCFYWALIPLRQESRLNRVHLRVVTVCYKRGITECGMDVVINGRAGDLGGSWGAWMKKLDAGISLRTPDGKKLFRGGTCLLAADTPAAAECMGTKKSVGPTTKSICRNCHCLQHEGAKSPHRAPNSFLAGLPGWKQHCNGRRQIFKLRNTRDMVEYLKKARAVRDGSLNVSYPDCLAPADSYPAPADSYPAPADSYPAPADSYPDCTGKGARGMAPEHGCEHIRCRPWKPPALLYHSRLPDGHNARIL